MECNSVTVTSKESVLQLKPEALSKELLSKEQRNVLLKVIFKEHSYSHPYQSLFQINEEKYDSKNISIPPYSVLKVSTTIWNDDDGEDEIDIEKDYYPSAISTVRYDISKARVVMDEVDVYLNSLWKDINKDEDKKIVRNCTCREQTELFDCIYKTINNYQLAKLTYEKHANEPVLRRLALDKATKRVHKSFSHVFWNPKHIAWLHGVLLDGLGSSLFLCYLEILQSLRRKEPELIERTLLEDKTATEKERSAGLPNLSAKLKKSWEPSVGLSTKINMEMFSITPFVLMIPSGPNIPHQSSKRSRFWYNQLSSFAKPISINVPAYKTPDGYIVKHYLEHCISVIRSKITSCRHKYPEHPIILAGWSVGSLIALKVALLNKVDAVICLGFPGKQFSNKEKEIGKEEYWQSFLKIECPVLFFSGAHGALSSFTETEKLCKSIKSETSFVVVEGGDDMLRLSKSLKMKLGITQNMIDKLIQDEIYFFMKKLFFHKFPYVNKQFNPKKKKKKIDLIGKEEIKIIRKRILQKKKPLQPLKIVPPPQTLLTPPSEFPINFFNLNKDNKNHSAGLLTTTNQYFTTSNLEETRNLVSLLSDQQTSSNKLSAGKPKNKKLSKDKFKKVRNIFTASFDSQPSAKKKSCPNNYYPVLDACNTTQSLQHIQAGLLSSSSTGQIQVQGSSFYYLHQTHSSLPKNSLESSTSVLPNLKGQLVSSGSGKQTIVVHPISRFVINQPTVSSLSTLNSLSNQITEYDYIAENINNCIDDKKSCMSTSTTSNCESQASSSGSLQSSQSVPTTSLLTELSSNDLRYFTNLILKQKNQTISSSSSICVSASAKCPTYTGISLGASSRASSTTASSTASSLVFDGFKHLSSSSLSNSRFVQNPFSSFEPSNEKVSVFKNVQASLHPPISQCNLNIRPTAASKKYRVNSPYFSGVCGNNTNGSFTLTYNPQYKNSKSTSIQNGVRVSFSSPTSLSNIPDFCSQKIANSVTTVATKALVSSSNTNISNVQELSRQKSAYYLSCNSTDIKGSGSLMNDKKNKKHFLNKNPSSIIEPNELVVKPGHLSEINPVDTCLSNNRFTSEAIISEKKAIDEQQRMYSLLQNFLKQSNVGQSQYMDVTRTDNLSLLNKVDFPTVAENAKGDGFYDYIKAHFDEAFALRTVNDVSKEFNQNTAKSKVDKKEYSSLSVDNIFNESVTRQQFVASTLNLPFSKNKMLYTNGQEILTNINSISSSYLSKSPVPDTPIPVTTVLLNNSHSIDKDLHSTVIDNLEKSELIGDARNVLHEFSQNIRGNSLEKLVDSTEKCVDSSKKLNLQQSNIETFYSATEDKNDKGTKKENENKQSVTFNPISSESLREDISKEIVSTESGDCKTAFTAGRKKFKIDNECFPKLNLPEPRSGRVSRDRSVDKLLKSSISKFADINKPEEPSSTPLLIDAPAIGENVVQNVSSETNFSVNGYSSQSDNILSDEVSFCTPLHEKPVDLMFKPVTENGGTNGSLKEFISAESQSFFMADSIVNLKNTLHSINNLKDKSLLFTEPTMSYLLKGDSFDNPDCSKKDIF
ncbi:uncharacterized protein LOC101236109 isoform X3 [Hydra vulgaris]|uniref:Uncharacterized protein LOC101236109 isoform X3 n=1 Tax=Hydra vulgaris TaxID=6087 RepID=A0ABM4BJE9_HYDVU